MTNTMTQPTFRLGRGTCFLLAIACGITVANVYLSQPLLNEIARYFGAAPEHASLVASLAQTGYACGILFVVPCADSLSPRRLCGALLVMTSLMLLASSFAPGLDILVIASFFLTTFTVIPQVIIPFAVSVADKGQTGRVIASLQTGLILGILLARTFSGVLADLTGTWRAPFLVAAVLNLSVLMMLAFCLPAASHHTPRLTFKRYLALLRPIPGLIVKYPPLLLSCLMGFLVFGAFSAFWATLAYYLASPAFGMTPAEIGLFGLWGAAGALLAPRMGRLSDRFSPELVNAVSLIAVALAFFLFWSPYGYPLALLVVGVNLLDFGLQSGQIANQARIFTLPAEFRARLNTVYMVFTFTGGAIGAAMGAHLWALWGWGAVCLLGIAMLILAATVLRLLSRRVRP
ncbi:MFS transporter [Samsonia erythrinae]|uniref:Putative MFS family arabinose efflux permease n=1 Tax=Samsonia erythrinae TaxID=160434 RepID=A0A4R3VQV8_9GAMM|nr:MFS transporter [Samsonia erythrinae]TCV06966.1 putative MFS family arabinose efflux permease [Samsonia erythrinae]